MEVFQRFINRNNVILRKILVKFWKVNSKEKYINSHAFLWPLTDKL